MSGILAGPGQGSRLAAFGLGLLAAFVFPGHDERVAVRHAVEGVMAQSAVVVYPVFPHYVPVPVYFLKASGHPAEGYLLFIAYAAQQVAVRQKFGIEAGKSGGLPFVYDVAFHVQKIAGRGLHGRNQRIAVQSLFLVVDQNAGGSGHGFRGLCPAGKEQKRRAEKGCGRECGKNKTAHECHPAKELKHLPAFARKDLSASKESGPSVAEIRTQGKSFGAVFL